MTTAITTTPAGLKHFALNKKQRAALTGAAGEDGGDVVGAGERVRELTEVRRVTAHTAAPGLDVLYVATR